MTPARLSLAHLTVLDAQPQEFVDAAVTGRFNAIGLRIVPPLPTDVIVPVVGDEPLIRRLLAKMHDTAIEVLNVESTRSTPPARARASGRGARRRR